MRQMLVRAVAVGLAATLAMGAAPAGALDDPAPPCAEGATVRVIGEPVVYGSQALISYEFDVCEAMTPYGRVAVSDVTTGLQVDEKGNESEDPGRILVDLPGDGKTYHLRLWWNTWDPFVGGTLDHVGPRNDAFVDVTTRVEPVEITATAVFWYPGVAQIRGTVHPVTTPPAVPQVPWTRWPNSPAGFYEIWRNGIRVVHGHWASPSYSGDATSSVGMDIPAVPGDVLRIRYLGDKASSAAETTITVVDNRGPTLITTPEVTAQLSSYGAVYEVELTGAVTFPHWSGKPDDRNMTVEASGSLLYDRVFLYPTEASPSTRTFRVTTRLTPGKHTITFRWAGDAGRPAASASTTFTLARVPVVAGGVRAPATARPGSDVVLRLPMRLAAGGVCGADLWYTLQARVPGTRAWKDLPGALRVDDDDCPMSVSFTAPSRTMQYRAMYDTRLYDAGPPPVVTIKAQRDVTVTRSGTAKAVVAKATTKPGAVLVLQRRTASGAWRSVQRSTVTTTKAFTIPRASTTRTYRVVAKADASGTSSISATFTVRRR